MRKILSILFLSVYFLATTQLVEVLRINIVFQHYFEHKTENPQLSFIAFLDMHYMHGSPLDKDYSRDMQLPFKAKHTVPPTLVIACIPSAFFKSPQLVNFLPATGKKIIFNTIPYSYTSYDVIWQPPRIA